MRLLSQISSFLLTAALAAACSSPAPAPQAEATPASTVSVDRGKYIVSTAGCHDCHTPMKMGPNGPEPDMTRALSGHPAEEKVEKGPALSGPWIAAVNSTGTAWSGPWGISYTANLTPDRNNGLGIWTEDMFMRAIREGKHMGTSRPILPPMPWQVYRNLTDDDLKSVFAYLKTLTPVANRVPDAIINEPKK
jgi:cytochrome c553